MSYEPAPKSTPPALPAPSLPPTATSVPSVTEMEALVTVSSDFNSVTSPPIHIHPKFTTFFGNRGFAGNEMRWSLDLVTVCL